MFRVRPFSFLKFPFRTRAVRDPLTYQVTVRDPLTYQVNVAQLGQELDKSKSKGKKGF
jgi:hypothetical protein